MRKDQEGGQPPKVETLRCMITDIISGKKGRFVILKPLSVLNSQMGIKGTITCSFSKIEGNRIPSQGDKVDAFNIHKVSLGWRARKAVIC